MTGRLEMSDSFTVFDGTRRLGGGSLPHATRLAQRALAGDPEGPVLMFDDRSGAVIDLDPRQALTPDPAAEQGPDARRRAQERAYRFMTTMAGDLPNYEEATRALFADDAPRLTALIKAWPADICKHALDLASPRKPGPKPA
jgi:hypothetical protein